MSLLSFLFEKCSLIFLLIFFFLPKAKTQDSLVFHQLPEIFISATPKIDTLSNTDYSVIDYLLLEDHILLLVYKNIFSKYELIILDKDFKEKNQLPLTDKRPIKLFESCLEGIYLITEFYHYNIQLQAAKIQLRRVNSVDFLAELANPCAWNSDNFLYFTKYYFQGQAMEYCAIPRTENHSSYTLPLIEDAANIRLLVEETGQRMPRSGDFWQAKVSNEFEELRNMEYRLRGMMKIFYPKLYVPIFSIDSMVLVFNHTESKLQYYTESGSPLQEIDIHYHQNKKWQRELLFDRIHQKVYTTFDTRWGEIIQAIDIKSGKTGSSFFIERPFIHHKQVSTGYLYFLYNDPYTQRRNRMLHRIKID